MNRSPSPRDALVSAGECPSEAPLLVALHHVPSAATEALSQCAREAGCRLYRGEEAASDKWVVAGAPEAIAALRNLLTPVRALDAAREDLELSLADRAAPEGLPQLRSELYQRTTVAEEMPVPPGTTMLVTKEFTFDAAHNLPRYHGKCERLHGHTFKLHVTLKAPLDTWSGMAFDFNDLKRRVQDRVISVLDHAYLNEIVPNPSAEYLAFWIWQRLQDLPLHEIKVWETPTSFVCYQGPPLTA